MTTSSASPTLFIDARALQDPGFQYRGVGAHIASILESRSRSQQIHFRRVGLIDEKLPPLPQAYCELFDQVSPVWNPLIPPSGCAFLDSSPLAHDGRLTERFLRRARLFRAAIVYDFIPFDWPGYLHSVADRIRYMTALARLRSCDLFLPISQYTATRLQELLGLSASRIAVTGACIRRTLACAARKMREFPLAGICADPYFLAAGGDDPRKNAVVVIEAFGAMRSSAAENVRLKITGSYSRATAEALGQTARECGVSDSVEFTGPVSDEELAQLYAGAVATVVPSHIEGFSLPVVEAALCGSPVIASACAAHIELLGEDDLFPPSDRQSLAALLTASLGSPIFRERLRERQSHLADAYTADLVAGRFWEAFEAAYCRRGENGPANVLRRRKPRVAFLSPFPPDPTGCAVFTKKTLEAAGPYFDVDLFCDSPRPLPRNDPWRYAGRIRSAAAVRSRYDAMFCVIGNSEFHDEILDFLDEFGGPCILHDSRLTHTYHRRLGETGFRQLCVRILGREPAADELFQWLCDVNPPTLFVEPLLARAEPLIVHTAPFQRILQEQYGVRAHLAPFAPLADFCEDDLKVERRRRARDRLGIPNGVFAIGTFGYVHRSKGCYDCIVALDHLRSWGIPAELYFIGASSLESRDKLDAVSNAYGVTGRVHFTDEYVSDAEYRDYMLAADANVSLRIYDFGQASAALADAISAAIPTVASAGLAAALDAPGYVRRIQTPWSPLLLAEALAELHGERVGREELLEPRTRYLETHSFRNYCAYLKDLLEGA